MELTKVINNSCTLSYCNGHYYVYTVTHVGKNVYVNFERIN
jgi:hypothetical protein